MKEHSPLLRTLSQGNLHPTDKTIIEKVLENERIGDDEALHLYEQGDLPLLSLLAHEVRTRKNGLRTYFNRNFHIEPTNVCVYSCTFCAYSEKIKKRTDGWELTMGQIMHQVMAYDGKPVTEVHIVGGVMPQYDHKFYQDLFRAIKAHRPDLHIKALTPVEYHYVFKKAKVSYEEGLKAMIAAGLDSMPGGGAEIFHPEIRDQIAGGKCSGDEWLAMHETFHQLGHRSNATMLYGHIEEYWHRVDHMRQLRELQDRTGGFQTFIPLKFRNQNNELSHIPETSVIEDLKNYAIGRIYLDNFDHVKAYWPMIGRRTAQVSLSFGVDDIDGTIDDTTKIYSKAGAEDQNPAMSTQELITLIRKAGFEPVERDTLYNVVHDFSVEEFQPEGVA
jgi:aminodeoxyfutalosine synthase